MKKGTQKQRYRMNSRRQFIQRFKTEVRDSSIQNLRISKIDQSCYKIYKTISKISNSNTFIQPYHIDRSKCSHNYQQLQDQKIINEAQDRSSYCENKQLGQTGDMKLHREGLWLIACESLQKQLQRKLDDIYKAIKERLKEMQQLSEVMSERSSEVKALEQYNEKVMLVQLIFKSTARLKSQFGFQLEAHNINVILKSLLQCIEQGSIMNNLEVLQATTSKITQQFIQKSNQLKDKDYQRDSNVQKPQFSLRFNGLKTQLDQINSSSVGQDMASGSSFKIENENTHQQEFLNIYMSNRNSKVSELNPNYYILKHHEAAKQFSRYCQDTINSEQQLFSKVKAKVIQQRYKKDTNKTTKKEVNSRYKKPLFISKSPLQNKKTFIEDQSPICDLLKCQQVHKMSENEVEDSDSKRQVLNEVIAMLNNKYNKCIKLQ